MKLRQVLASAAVIAMLALTGCVKREPVRGTVTGGDTSAATTTAAETTTTEAVRLGSTTGGVYQNTFIGIGCKFSSDWTIYSDEEIRELNQLSMDALSDEYAEMLEKATILYDFSASKGNGENVNINLEKLTAIQALTMDTEAYVDASLPTLKDALASMGATAVSVEKTKLAFAGEETFGIKASMSIEGVSFYETIVCLKRGTYIANITASGFEESRVNATLDSFYAL